MNLSASDVIGHLSFGGIVMAVFIDSNGNQFILCPNDGEKMNNDRLRPDEQWRVIQNYRPDRSIEAQARAFHEAGHAVACMIAGVKVEFVTIVEREGFDGKKRSGYCRFDYDIRNKLLSDILEWAPRVALAQLGGPLADERFRSENALAIPSNIRFAWDNDCGNAQRCLEKASESATWAHSARTELCRRRSELKNRFQEPHTWDAIGLIADMLCIDGAVSGDVIRELYLEATTATR